MLRVPPLRTKWDGWSPWGRDRAGTLTLAGMVIDGGGGSIFLHRTCFCKARSGSPVIPTLRQETQWDCQPGATQGGPSQKVKALMAFFSLPQWHWKGSCLRAFALAVCSVHLPPIVMVPSSWGFLNLPSGQLFWHSGHLSSTYSALFFPITCHLPDTILDTHLFVWEQTLLDLFISVVSAPRTMSSPQWALRMLKWWLNAQNDFPPWALKVKQTGWFCFINPPLRFAYLAWTQAGSGLSPGPLTFTAVLRLRKGYSVITDI